MIAEVLIGIWGLSAAVCFEAYSEVESDLPPKERNWVAIAIGSLIPVLNTFIALFYAHDKIRRN